MIFVVETSARDGADDDGEDEPPHAASPRVTSAQAAIDNNGLRARERVCLVCDMVKPFCFSIGYGLL